MFTDEPSPFKPRSNSGLPATVLVLAVFTFIGAYTYFSRVSAHKESAKISSRTIPRPAAARSERLDQMNGNEQRSIPVTVAPKAERRGEPSNLNLNAHTTIYLCKAYSGGTFWSDMTCSAQRATVDRMTTVPASLPFQQQVAIARGEAQEAALLYQAPQPVNAAAIGSPAPVRDRTSLCDVYDHQVRDLDAEARQPLSARRQDQIRSDRMNVMTARAREHC